VSLHAFDGKINVEFDKSRHSRVTFTVRTGSVAVGSDLLAALIRSSAFFNSAKFPDATFSSTETEKPSAKTVRVTGNMTVLGGTHPETFEVLVEAGLAEKGPLGYKALGAFKRSKYGMTSGIQVIDDADCGARIRMRMSLLARRREGGARTEERQKRRRALKGAV